jgi:hypothetical protein
VEYPIETSSRPAPTNVAEVTAARPDGSCDAVLVCNCHAGLRHARERPATEDDLLVCTPCTPGAAPCGAGRRIEGVASTQRQVVCSGCMQVSALRTPHSGGLISEVSSRRCTLGGLISEVSSRRSHLGGLISEGSSRRSHLGGLISEVSSRRSHLGGLISEVSSRRSHLGGLISEGSSRRCTLGAQPHSRQLHLRTGQPLYEGAFALLLGLQLCGPSAAPLPQRLVRREEK